MNELFARALLELHENAGRLSDDTLYDVKEVLDLNPKDEDEDDDKDKDTATKSTATASKSTGGKS